MSVLQIDYYKNGQFKGASGASIFQSSNSQSSIAFKFEDDIEDAIVFANILLPYPENSQLYGQYKAQSLIMEKKVDPNGGYIYIGQLLAQYLQTNGKAYVNAQIQASEGLYKFQSNGSVIIIGGVIYTYSISNNLLVLTNNLTGKVYNQVNAGVITVENVIYKITELTPSVLKMETGFTVDNYQRVEFKITASEPYYSAMPMTPEESIIFADAIAKNQYDIVNLQQDKQDKDDPLINPDANPGDDNDHTVVGNINSLISNYKDINEFVRGDDGIAEQVADNTQDIETLKTFLTIGLNIVGTYEITSTSAEDNNQPPTPEELTTFIEGITGLDHLEKGDACFVYWNNYEADDKQAIYYWNGTSFNALQMSPVHNAQNDIAGLIEGTYKLDGLSTPNTFMVDIQNGHIANIYRVDSNGNSIDLKSAMDQVIAKLVGNVPVNRATADKNGNDITTKYMTKGTALNDGASHQYVQDYASPKALYDLNYPDYALGQFKSATVSDTSYNKTTNSTSVGYTPLATITKSLEADILLGDQNGLINRLWISANITEDVKLRITTAYIDGNNQTQTLSVEETDVFGLVAGNAKLLQIESVFSGLTQPITLPAGTTLTQTIEVWREASASADFTLLSNTTYNAYMTLNKIGYVRYSLEQEPDAIITGHDSAPTIDSDGDLQVASTDGEINYKNGASAPLTTIVKIPMASGINANEVRPPKAGDVKTALDLRDIAIAKRFEVFELNLDIGAGITLNNDIVAKLTTTPRPIILYKGVHYYPSDKSVANVYYWITANINATTGIMDIIYLDGNNCYTQTAEYPTKAQVTNNATAISNLQTDVAQRFKVYNLDGGLIGTNVSNAIKTLLTTNPRPIIFFNNQYYYPSSGSGTLYYWDLDNADPSTGVLKTIYLNGNELGETTSAYPTIALLNTKASKSVAGEEYDPTSTYNQYDTCQHNGKAYYRSSSTPATGTWSDTGWTEFDMGALFFNARDLDNNKQDNLTFDNTPTAGSNNPVKSSGIKQYVDDKITIYQTTLGASNWVLDSTITNPYKYKKGLTVTLSGHTFNNNTIVFADFDYADAVSGEFSPEFDYTIQSNSITIWFYADNVVNRDVNLTIKIIG